MPSSEIALVRVCVVACARGLFLIGQPGVCPENVRQDSDNCVFIIKNEMSIFVGFIFSVFLEKLLTGLWIAFYHSFAVFLKTAKEKENQKAKFTIVCLFLSCVWGQCCNSHRTHAMKDNTFSKQVLGDQILIQKIAVCTIMPSLALPLLWNSFNLYSISRFFLLN